MGEQMKRYSTGGVSPSFEHSNGEWVKYADHLARIEQLEKALLSERQAGCATIAKQRYRIEQLEAERDKLKSKVESLRKGHREQQLGSKRLNESLGIVVSLLNELKDRSDPVGGWNQKLESEADHNE